MWLGAIAHLLLRWRSHKRSSLPVWIYACAPESWPEDRKEADGSRLQGWESTEGIWETGDTSELPLSWSVCWQVKAFADGLVGNLNLRWLEKSPPSMHILPFAHCLGAVTSDGGPAQIKGCWSSPCHIQVSISCLSWPLQWSLVNLVVATAAPGTACPLLWLLC